MAISTDIILNSEFDRYLLQDPDGHKLNLFCERKQNLIQILGSKYVTIAFMAIVTYQT